MIINNQKGSLILQSLIAMAIFGGVIASILRLLQMQDNLSVKTTEEFETVYFINEVRNVLSNPDACKATFAGKTARSDRTTRKILQHLTEKNGSEYTFPIFEKEQFFKETKNYSLKIKDIYLLQHDDEVRVAAGSTGLHFNIEFINNRNNRVKIIERKIKLFVAIDENEKITSCYSLRGLGLGKKITQEESQWIRKSDQSGHFIQNNKLLIGVQKAKAELTIAGGFKLIDDNSPCTLEKNHSVKYNSKSNRFEKCSGASRKWIDIDKNSLNISRYKVLRVALPLKIANSHAKYKTCRLRTRDSVLGQCKLTRSEDGHWSLTQEIPGSKYGTCEAICNN
ncbi:hypothetical protein [Halobacteriovorax sp. HLS]|uniref:hypothetical protein n=1 Tax=Halobacteriovorax sp. HLS TaxID=2234000 RepID=UPI000FDB3208|nr:hypothetical protein [Halobacteriovorax sp. HLS]